MQQDQTLYPALQWFTIQDNIKNIVNSYQINNGKTSLSILNTQVQRLDKKHQWLELTMFISFFEALLSSM